MEDVKKRNGGTTLVDVVEQLKGLRDDMNVRLDGVLKIIGGRHRNHEQRIAALEKAVAQLKKAS
jgi:hypothetical protein